LRKTCGGRREIDHPAFSYAGKTDKHQ